MTCPHWQNSTCSLLLPHGITRIAGPGNPNWPCPRCQAEWIDGQPPTETSLTPTLRGFLAIARPQPVEWVQVEEKPKQGRPACDDIGPILKNACCEKLIVYQCDSVDAAKLNGGRTTRTACDTCLFYVPPAGTSRDDLPDGDK